MQYFYEEFEVKQNDVVVCTITNSEVIDAVTDEINVWVNEYDLADLQNRVYHAIEDDKIWSGNGMREFYYSDNIDALNKFIDRWTHFAFINILTANYIKKWGEH